MKTTATVRFDSVALARGQRIGDAATPSYFSLLLFFALSVLYCSTSAYAQNWTLTSAPTNAWSAIAGSADLTVLAATVDGGGIYYSTNSGTNWNLSDAPSNSWVSIASSTNGLVMAAIAAGGGIWISSDLGDSWVMSEAPTNLNWAGVASSASGATIVAVAPGAGVWISTNSGHWTSNDAPASFIAIASSADASILLATDYDGLFVSTNCATDWVLTDAPESGWRSVSSSADGLNLASACGLGIYTSVDSGATWNASIPGNWKLVCSSSNGNKLAAVADPDGLFVSADAGGGWTQVDYPGYDWIGIVLSSDGNHLAALREDGAIYKWQPTIPLIAGQPETQTAIGGLDPILSVGAFSTAPLSYQWQLNGMNLLDATNATLALINVGPRDAGNYTLVLSNSYGTAVSSNAVLTVVPAVISTLSPDWGISDAILGGSVTTGSNSTVVWFNWGADTNYGNSTAAYNVDDGAVSLVFSNRITRLTPYTTYHFQAAASNSLGLVLGTDAVFTTAPRFLLTSGTNGDWNTVAWTADGNKMAASWSNIIYISGDSGVSWTATGGTGYYVILSADGTKVIGVGESVLSASTNSGANWTTNSTPAAFSTIAASADASTLIAVGGRQLYTSTNVGATWTLTGAPSEDWVSVASSADGTKLVALAYIREGGLVYRSTDSGASWTGNTSTDGEYYIGTITSSADGSVLIMTGDEGWISTNSGVSWDGPVLGSTTAAACSADGTKLIVVYLEEQLFPPTEIFVLPSLPVAFQPDPAVLANAPSPDSLSETEIVLITADGSGFAALINGNIYVAPSIPAPLLNVVVSSSDLILSWMVPTTSFILQQSSDLANWSTVTAAPILNITNLQNQVTLPISQTQSFYRLKTP
jgi:hypothetical protein